MNIMARQQRRRKPPSTAQLQAKTVANAYNTGLPWSEDEVSALVNGITRDATTFDIAMSIGRSYYAVQGARAHVRFALSHASILLRASKVRKIS